MHSGPGTVSLLPPLSIQVSSPPGIHSSAHSVTRAATHPLTGKHAPGPGNLTEPWCVQECTFEPELVAAYKAAKGRALEAAMQSSYPSRSMLNSSQASLRDTFRDSHQQPDGAEVCCSLWDSSLPL